MLPSGTSSILGVTLVATIGGSQLASTKQDMNLDACAQQINQYMTAMESYRIDALNAGTSPASPSVADLIAGKYLPQGFSPETSCGPTLQGSITNNGASYVTNVWLNSPPRNLLGQPDPGSAALLVYRLGVRSGMSTSGDPGHITGYQGKWNGPNPAGSQPYIVAMASTTSTSSGPLAVLTNGSRPMTGTLDMGGNSIVGASSIASTGTLTAQNGNFTSVNAPTVSSTTLSASSATTGALTSNTVAVNNTLTVNGALNASWANVGSVNANYISSNGDIGATGTIHTRSNATGWVNDANGGGWIMTDPYWLRSVNDKGVYTGGMIQGGVVNSNGRLSAEEYLFVGGVATPGGGCSDNGLSAREANGAPLYCVNSVWTKP